MKLLPKRLRKLIAALLLTISMLSVTGCATTSVPLTPSECAWSQPLSWHEADTPTTQRGIFAHNLKWEKFCA